MAVSVCGSFHHLKISASSAPLSGKHCKYTGQSVRAVPIRILTVGKKRSPGVSLLADEYIAKLRYYCTVEDVQVRSNPRNARDGRAQVQDEDLAVMNLIRSDDWVVILDENGLDVGSEKMAELVGDAGNTGASRLSFCIGGPYGHGKQLRKRANVSVKLSSMVLNHQIALLVLVEQLYSVLRALGVEAWDRMFYRKDDSSGQGFAYIFHGGVGIMDHSQRTKVSPLAISS